MSYLEILIYLLVSGIVIAGVVWVVPKLSSVDPYILKAEVFSKLVELRNSGNRGLLRIDGKELRLVILGREAVRLVIPHEVDVLHANTGYIVYRDGRIVRSGTLYGREWSVSFQPVTGLMSVEVGR